MGFAAMHAAAMGTLLQGGAFGELVLYRPAAGGEYEVSAIFGTPYEAADVEGVDVTAELPTVGLRLSDLAALSVEPVQFDEVVVRSVRYRVAEVRPDGEGWVRLPLHLIEAP